MVCPELPTAPLGSSPWITLHLTQPAQIPLIYRGLLFKRTEPLLIPLTGTGKIDKKTLRQQLALVKLANAG